MRVSVLFFGGTAEIVGERNIAIDVSPSSTSSAVLDTVLKHHPKLAMHRLLYSVNERYATGFETLAEGDRVGIFTAVSGG
jgi:molybdopterin converting factor small subunit